MPTYGENNFKESNVNYLNKDFSALKQSLINYAKSYFPDTYRDFNEASPGMMLLEMNAYVGDVLSFYIDQQYQEMLLPLAEERRNIINMASMFGYKVKPIIPSFVNLTFTSNVDASSGDSSKVDYTNAAVFDAGIELVSSTNSQTIFTTLEPIDFKVTGSDDTNSIATTTDSGLASSYTLSRRVKAVSATEKVITFRVGNPEKFKTLTIPDTNVIDIVSCVDSNGSNWYEVDFLAQDKVPIPTHYTNDDDRNTAYSNALNDTISDIAVPFSLSYITTTKRFTRETNLDNTTSLVFGNGVLRNGIDGSIDQGYIDMEQVGIVIPGQTNDLNDAIDPLLGNEYSTLGETPNNTTLTITYRVGGGISSNVPSGDVTTLPSPAPTPALGSTTLVSVTNDNPAVGGKDEEDTIEIKEKARAFFSTQNRCVTKEDYEARVLNIPARFGNIAKVYVTRNVEGDVSQGQQQFNTSLTTVNDNSLIIDEKVGLLQTILSDETTTNAQKLTNIVAQMNDLIQASNGNIQALDSLNLYSDLSTFNLSSISIYVLAYNNRKQLVGNPNALNLGKTDNIPQTLFTNISNYLTNFRLMTDTIALFDGYVVNFGVFFDIIAEKFANKQQVKLNCIQKIKDYFQIEKMQFNQPIFKSNLEFELMGVEGVRSIGHVTITQDDDYFYQDAAGNPTGDGDTLPNATYSYSYDASTGEFEDSSGDNGGGTEDYGYKYNFKNALSEDGTIVRPPHSSTPAVFELKNPNQNIQGRVR
tara:strand:+ start:1 stop:2265 length:2265 start_codon:yes stop_codon:yes gene_type:complete